MESLAVPFDHTPRTRIVFGAGVISRLGELAAELGLRRVLVVTDVALVQAGHAAVAERSLRDAGLTVARFEGVTANPTTAVVAACAAAAREIGCDGFVGLGGGSSIDAAKGANLLFTSGGRMEDYWGYGKATQPLLPLLAVPTTAGTGSEVQSYALIHREPDLLKMACGDPGLCPRVALLDPELTFSQPDFVTACTGVDTITHAVESYVTTARNVMSSLYAREAFRLSYRFFPAVLQDPRDATARAALLQAATFGGLAIENSMLGAAHSLANPLTTHFDVAHGQAVGCMLPHVVRFNAAEGESAARYLELAASAGLCPAISAPGEAAALLAGWLEQQLGNAGLAGSLAQCKVPRDALPKLAEDAAEQWTAQFNPRPVTVAELTGLYEGAFESS